MKQEHHKHNHDNQDCHHNHNHPEKTGRISKSIDVDVTYTCPMHPEIQQRGPGNCPKCGMALEPMGVLSSATKTTYTCPMHPEVIQDHPGACPKCGMALEPVTSSGEEKNEELIDMSLSLIHISEPTRRTPISY